MESIGDKIPKQFKTFGSTIEVVFDNKYLNNKSLYGEASYSENKIILADVDGVDALSPDRILDTFYHEKVHMILEAMGELELTKNEKFVEVFSKLLRQADITSEY